MEDDDEFGDLYTDVLQNFSVPQPYSNSPAPAPCSLPHQIDLNLKSDPTPVKSYPNSTPIDLSTSRPQLSELHAPARARDVNGVGKGGELAEKDVKFDIEEVNNEVLNDDVSVIPGIGSEVVVKAEKNESKSGKGNGDVAAGEEEEDWDSDSEDDLQIVLNDENHRPMVIDEGGGDDDDDDDEDGDPLVIVDDVDANNQGLLKEEEDWGGAGAGGDEAAAAGSAVEGGVDKKEGGDRVNGGPAGGVAAAAAKIGYSNHYGYHNPYHSQFKYVRPGAAPIPGPTTVGPGGAPGQVRPLVNMGPTAGRGRGDWRPTGLKNAPPMQRGFPGMPGPGNNMAGRGFGVGLEFTLPSHKTIFDVDIDGFEEKPWKYPGVDVSDFFNFGLTEESWKDYCKQLEQHRLETTMQSKIRVYESGRTDQEYDPDLPPELAAATGILDVAADNANVGKSDVGQSDLAKGPARVRPPIPTGRAIQVEGGYGERLPSIDTRPPRIRDSDAIIEIVCQDSVDDESSVGNGDQDNDLPREDLRGGKLTAEDEMGPVDKEYFDGFPGAFDSRKRELVGRRAPFMNSVQNNMPEGDGVLPFPPEAARHYHPGSRGQTSKHPGENVGTSHEDRRIQGRARDRSPHLTPSRSPQSKNFDDNQDEESVESMQDKNSPSSSPVAARDARELSVENKDDVPDELGPGDGSSAMDKEETNTITTSDTRKDGNSVRSMKKQKVGSQVGQPDLEFDEEDSRAARSSENSKARSGSSRDYKKWRDGAEEEVMQDSRSTRTGSVKKHLEENEQSFRRKDRDGRQDFGRNRMAVKGREGSYPNRELDPSMVHHVHMKPEGFDRRKERENPDAVWQRRDEDPYSRKNRIEDSRKREREHGDDMGPRHRGKARESERSDKDEHLYSRKQLDNGSYRVHYDKDPSSRHRERDDNLKGKNEMVDDYISKRRKDDEYSRRDYADRDDILHGPRDSTSRRKRERDDVLELRKRDDQQRIRENFDDHHPVRHKDEVWLQRERGERQREREREEWHRLKPHEEILPSSKREDGRGTVRTGRSSEDKSWAGHARIKDDYKGSDKEYQLKDSTRQSELKRRERIEDESFSNHRGREDVYVRGNQYNNEERKSRQERSTPRNDRAFNASDNSRVTEKKHKENTRKNKESEGGDHNSSIASRRNQEDQSGHSSEMVCSIDTRV
ncbi:hypothetical protein Pint_14575 [Pistacia integerrima]|uniref:Uncharacterized protein n=1 Tax=Pistacia integerrima TaxID=434235 RepID=A0ACC0Y8V4_9ROSI|nr:hypothetical protein Pint_14575 [Pistacia integerrima]